MPVCDSLTHVCYAMLYKGKIWLCDFVMAILLYVCYKVILNFWSPQMLASRTEEPQEMTIEYLNVIHDLFTFYHQSVSRILKVHHKSRCYIMFISLRFLIIFYFSSSFFIFFSLLHFFILFF